MLDWICFWSQPMLGLDIQDEEIRLMQLQSLQKKKKIKLALSCPLPSGAVINRKIMEPQIVSDCLHELVRKNKLKMTDAAVALPMDCVTTHSMSIIKGLHDSEMEAEVLSYLSQHMPGGTENLCYDYAIAESLNEQQSHLFLVATSFEYLDVPVSVLQNAGLKARVVDVDRYVLERAVKFIKKNSLEMDEKWFMSCGLALRGIDPW